ncbi:aminotransferase class I/II-fold pyridoxal phosphate-dependent enzyme [candidate division KSB1 bacterium]|nr:aminotransferase class I/II-fold pyridoxal phosphate-dependent enzyme [candidate division KSB1 bacterium]
MKDPDMMGFTTQAIHAGLEQTNYGEVSVPIYQTSTFSFINAQDGAEKFSGKKKGYIYTRMGNPTIEALEKCVATLEHGYAALGTSSGMSAVTTLYMTFLGAGMHLISTDAVYGPSRSVLERDFSRFGVEYSFVDTTKPEKIEQAIQDKTKMLYIETPANPTITLTDIEACAKIAHRHGIVLAVDNTFCSPYLQNPLELGADVVLHSLTKFINGHADIVGGIIVAKEKELFEEIRKVLFYMGGTMDPHQAWLVLRGVRTLPLRVDRAQENALRIAQFLLDHPKVDWVTYPGLDCHPQYELAKKQMKGSGSMISFGVKKGLEGGKTVMNNVQLVTLAVSLGGIESLIQHPASMTHAAMSRKEREKAHITDELIRLSVGCENVDDLIRDLDQALNKI